MVLLGEVIPVLEEPLLQLVVAGAPHPSTFILRRLEVGCLRVVDVFVGRLQEVLEHLALVFLDHLSEAYVLLLPRRH